MQGINNLILGLEKCFDFVARVYKTLQCFTPAFYLYSATFISVYDTNRNTRLRHDKQVPGKVYVALHLRSSEVRLRFSSMHPKHA